VSTPTADDVRPQVLEYARAFIAGYSETIESHFLSPKIIISAAGLADEYFPLCGRKLGANLAIAVFYTQIDFYLFFRQSWHGDRSGQVRGSLQRK
jgi:hypothetical protein